MEDNNEYDNASNPKVTKQVADILLKSVTSTLHVVKSLEKSAHEIQFYIDMLACRDIREFGRKIKSILNEIGFFDFTFTRLVTANNEADPFVTISKEHIISYYEEEFQIHDLFPEHCKKTTKPFYQSAADEFSTNCPCESLILKRNKETLKLAEFIVTHERHKIE